MTESGTRVLRPRLPYVDDGESVPDVTVEPVETFPVEVTVEILDVDRVDYL